MGILKCIKLLVSTIWHAIKSIHIFIEDLWAMQLVATTYVIIVPTPNVSVTITGNQTVGQTLMLECNTTTLRGVTSDTYVTWYRGGIMVRNMTMINSSVMGNSQVYTDLYTISPLSTTDDGGAYLCKVLINSSPQLMVNDSVTLTNVTG